MSGDGLHIDFDSDTRAIGQVEQAVDETPLRSDQIIREVTIRGGYVPDDGEDWMRRECGRVSPANSCLEEAADSHLYPGLSDPLGNTQCPGSAEPPGLEIDDIGRLRIDDVAYRLFRRRRLIET